MKILPLTFSFVKEGGFRNGNYNVGTILFIFFHEYDTLSEKCVQMFIFCIERFFMLQKTYARIRQLFLGNNGYLRTGDLLKNGVTTLQIRQLLEDGTIEKVSHGIYWWLEDDLKKPKNYRYLEVQLADTKSVICMESALYLGGLLKKEPAVLSVATSRTDRSRIRTNFPIKRRYFAEHNIHDYVNTLETPCGPIHYYSIDRSVVDCIRLRSELEEGRLESILKAYKAKKDKNIKDYMDYAKAMGIQRVAEAFLK